jgi:glycosyltransferase involved in cell wall biosynthesis
MIRVRIHVLGLVGRGRRRRDVRRLGLFIDGAFRTELSPGELHVFTGSELLGFMRFACAVGSKFQGFRLIARQTGDVRAAPYQLPAGVQLAALPHYPSLRDVGQVALALPRAIGPMWRALRGLDAVWISGVHPLGLLLSFLAALRGVRVVLLIRQNSPEYFRSRLPSGLWRPLLLPLGALDFVFRVLALRLRTTVVGSELGHLYRAPRRNVLVMRINLLERSQLASGPRLAEWSDEVRLLTVGRIEPEKNPLLVIQALARLQDGASGDYRLIWAGEGRLAGQVLKAAESAGVRDRVELRGFVPFGPPLLELYRDAHAFVHVALTEGAPQVIYEAMGCGLPIVATDVGGVRGALAHGEAGLLVPPNNVEELSAAVERLRADPGLRRRLASRALELAGDVTIDDEILRVVEFVRGMPAA